MTGADVVTLIFSGVIAVSTVIYTLFSIRLWTATRLSADIARYTLFLNFTFELHRQVEFAKATNKPDALALAQFEQVILELGVKSLLKGVDLKKNPELAEYLARLDGMLRTTNPNDAAWLRQVIQQSTGKK